MPKVSVILLSFNRPEMLVTAVNSVKTQTEKDWELLVAEFSSNKEKKKQIIFYLERESSIDSRIKLIDFPPLSKEENETTTPYATKINETFKVSTGEFITYLVDDDVYKPQHLQRCLEAFKRYSEARIVYGGQVVLYKKDGKLNISHILPSKLIRRNMFSSVDHIAICHKRNVFDEVGGWSDDVRVRRWGDAEFFYRIARAKILAYPTQYVTTVKLLHNTNLNLYGSHYEE